MILRTFWVQVELFGIKLSCSPDPAPVNSGHQAAPHAVNVAEESRKS